MPFTNEELKQIKSDLPRGSVKELAVQFNLKPGSIRSILSGINKNDDVVLAAFARAKEHKDRLELVKQQLAS